MKKMLPWLVSLLLAITLIISAGIYVWNQYFSGSHSKDPAAQAAESVKNVEANTLSADELLKVTSELTDIKTNIADTSYVVITGFIFQLDSEKSKEEFDKIKDIVVRPIINRALWVMKPEDLQGTKGKDQLYAGLINSINEVLTEGKVTKVELKDFIMQQV
ncbi:flagellar basal body protein FliL [Cohnella sp. CFH 77786]|uniref:flagellar basal body-associated FliL family protein n=1 Tax=Cohnella sp. CFH 77786 TaxID=2662265 RepID=UPI001C60E591|nr:flagellar basal body-associated FliL family protein [Cohnella sp. CFH 77786]MBW5444567.1 flagellar basal body protein FliL [Cohnella sp. CFH 77786]